jgi:hypothetical protein
VFPTVCQHLVGEGDEKSQESNLLFPSLVKVSAQVMGAIDKRERDHMHSEKAARDL